MAAVRATVRAAAAAVRPTNAVMRVVRSSTPPAHLGHAPMIRSAESKLSLQLHSVRASCDAGPYQTSERCGCVQTRARALLEANTSLIPNHEGSAHTNRTCPSRRRERRDKFKG
eukprot:m.36383 g.36383  ORF g.36383 m.36383 type:complete len:114 (+) comp7568_c0_seq2:2028-2369(+)